MRPRNLAGVPPTPPPVPDFRDFPSAPVPVSRPISPPTDVESLKPRNLAGVSHTPPPVPDFTDFPLAPVPPTQPCGLRPAVRRRAPSVPLPRLSLAPQPPTPEEDDNIHGSHVRTLQRLRSRGTALPELRAQKEMRAPVPPLQLPPPVPPLEPRPSRRPRSHSRSLTTTPVPSDAPRAATVTPPPAFLEPVWPGSGIRAPSLPRAPSAPRAPGVLPNRSWRHRRPSSDKGDEKIKTQQNSAEMPMMESNFGKQVAGVAEQPQQAAEPQAMKGDHKAEDDPEVQKRRAVLTLQKFFFDELARGGSPNGSAARALLRLNAEAAPLEESVESRSSTSTSGTSEEEDPEPRERGPAQDLPLRPSPPPGPSPAFRGPHGRNAIRVSNYM